MSIFKGFKLSTPAGYLSEREQDELVRFVLSRVRADTDAARDIRAFLADEQHVIASDTLRLLRTLASEWLDQRRRSK